MLINTVLISGLNKQQKRKKMSNRQEKTAYEFTNYKPISVHKKVYDELTDLSNNIYDIKLSYAKTIEHLINYYKENKTKKLK
jgi:hypothetical protein